MLLPSHLLDQETDYIKARGFDPKDFSPEQVQAQKDLARHYQTRTYFKGFARHKSTAVGGGHFFKKIEDV